jgi:hypothetical protein
VTTDPVGVFNWTKVHFFDRFPSAVYAIFHATVRVIDTAKKDALQAQLLAELTHTKAGESLEQKLSKMNIKTGIARTRTSPIA